MKNASFDNSDKNETPAKYTQRFQALFNYASIGILLTDADGNIILVNDFALKQFGYQFKELVEKKIEILIPPRFHLKHEKYREGYNEHPKSRHMGIGRDLHAIKKDGTEFPVEVSLSHYRNDEGAFVIAFITDITERVNAREQIIKLNNELEKTVELRTQQLADTLHQLELSKDEQEIILNKEKELGELKSKFISIASHEFRTPLSTILSSIYLINKYQAADEQPKREKHIHRIISSVNMLTDILNDFLSLSKMEEGKMQVRISEINIKELVDEMSDDIQTILKPGQTIKYEHHGNEIGFLDPSLLKHILLNLLSNAVKFSHDNGSIEIYTFINERNVELVVKDYGIGISKEEQQHLFERFFRAGNAMNIQGSGLGLHIVGRYVELMNGNIEFLSELDKGTEFKVTFNYL
ncbi:PAS domain-containing sensor histidine kinase [Chitinophagaceae bacterium IBVUCB2]|nr:PAS domain-containing sensor histidine kinase [Chitinophagaceae bacterium IBVUCB2]